MRLAHTHRFTTYDDPDLVLLRGGAARNDLAEGAVTAIGFALGKALDDLGEIAEAYNVSSAAKASQAATLLEKWGCPYEQAMVLFEGRDDDKRKAISIVQNLGATAVYEKLKQEMRNLGIKNIPRGIRNSTRSNAAFLTNREMDILRLLKEGLQNKEIGEKLYISAKTVDHHVSSILFKLEADSRFKAVAEAVRMGILS